MGLGYIDADGKANALDFNTVPHGQKVTKLSYHLFDCTFGTFAARTHSEVFAECAPAAVERLY